MTRYSYQTDAPDDQPVVFSRSDLSGGVNSRQDETIIDENQATVLTNCNLDVPGEVSMRPGLTLVEDLGNDPGTGIFGFEPDGGTNLLVVTHGTKLETWPGSSTFTERKTDFTTSLLTTIVKAGKSGSGDIFLASNGTDNVFEFDPTGDLSTPTDCLDTNTSPPKTRVMTYFRNRVWALKSNLLYFSDAFPDSYVDHFDRTTNAFRMPCGTERSLIPLRDLGIIILGADQVWGLNPSITPDPTTDKPEKILDIGCVAGNTAVQAGDDVLFMATDGVRGVFRTQQDKLQLGASYPLSYVLKTEFSNINWTYIQNAAAIYFDNKYFITLTSGTSTYNNQVWIYYPAFKGWTVVSGWNVAKFAQMKVAGENRLYCVDSVDGKVYRAWSGTSDNGTAITFQEEGRAETFGQPHVYKSGGDVRVKAKGGSGVITVSVNKDGEGWAQLGTLTLAISGATFPTTFPISFSNLNETSGIWHLESSEKFKKIKLKIYSTTLNAVITILERTIITYQDEYQSEA